MWHLSAQPSVEMPTSHTNLAKIEDKIHQYGLTRFCRFVQRLRQIAIIRLITPTRRSRWRECLLRARKLLNILKYCFCSDPSDKIYLRPARRRVQKHFEVQQPLKRTHFLQTLQHAACLIKSHTKRRAMLSDGSFAAVNTAKTQLAKSKNKSWDGFQKKTGGVNRVLF